MKKILQENKENATILIISIVAFIAGWLAIGFLLSFLIIGIADLLLFIPNLKQFKQKHINRNEVNIMAEKNRANITKQKKTVKKNQVPKKKGKKKKILKIIVIILLVLFIATMIAGICFWRYIANNAPEFNPSLLYQQEATVIYNNQNQITKKLGTEQRENLTYDELPEVLINAIIATEDSRFFQHNGFDLPRFLKASFQQALGKGGGGASTLTMQISKNTYTSREVSIVRKFTDIYMAMFEIEQNYTKQEILEFYVNYPYLGGGAYGVEQACQNYFGKSAKEINLSEAALIAGLFQSPSGYDPYIYPEKAEARRNTVLYLMAKHGYITSEQKEIASSIPIQSLLVNKENSNSENYQYQAFIDTVVAEVKKNTGLDPYTTPMEIYTTMDTSKQDYIDGVMNGENFTWENEVVDAGIAVVDVNTGALVAVGSGRRKGEKIWNNATQISNQIGSTSKPIYDYAVGIEYENWSTYTPFVDEQHSYSDGTSVQNWDGKYKGWMTLRTALAESRNIPALKAFQLNKNSNIKTMALNLGLHPEISESGILHEAHSIGGYTGEAPIDMAAAYAAFANEGIYTKPYSYTKIVYRETGETEENKIVKTQAMSAATASIMTSLLKDSAAYGLGGQSNINGTVYGAKTGTSNYTAETKKAHGLPYNAVNDLWVNGTSPNYAISVWYGYEKVNPSYVSTVNTIQHRKLFQAVGKGIFIPGSNFKTSNDVVEIPVEMHSEPVMIASENTPSSEVTTELFKKGHEPTITSAKYIKLGNVTNLKQSTSNSTLTLTWDSVSKQEGAYNNWGEIVYKIYDANNSLINTVSTNSIKISNPSSSKYIVKVAYEKYNGNMSSGKDITLESKNETDEVIITLKGEASIAIEIGTTFTDPGYLVMAGKKDVTSKATLKSKVITDSTNNKTIEKINTASSGAYIITYTIDYNGTSKKLTRNVVVTAYSGSGSSNNSSST